MTTMTNNDVAGVAAYLEFAKRDGAMGYVYQVLITPEARTPDGHVVPMTAYRRRMTTLKTRAQWKQFGSSVRSSDAITRATGEITAADEMLHFLVRAINQFKTNSYTLVTGTLPENTPVLVEVTHEDMNDVRLGKTPYKILGRVWKVRKARNFPASVIPS
jgi:hypothetical protein